jgi:hypothetical protein
MIIYNRNLSYIYSLKLIEWKAWIDLKSPRFSYLNNDTIYWGWGIWCEIFDTSNESAKIRGSKNL